MQNTERRKHFFRSFEAKSLSSRSILTQISDDLTNICGSTPFLILHMIFFSSWILINTGNIPYVVPFDPFPFGLLTMVVSLEAIFLALFILVSQNRSAYINTIREEVHMNVNLIAEEEITKALQVLAEIRREMGIKREDPELEQMLKRIDTNYMERTVLEQMEKANKPVLKQLATQLKNEFPDLILYPVTKPMEIVHNLASNDNVSSVPTEAKVVVKT